MLRSRNSCARRARTVYLHVPSNIIEVIIEVHAGISTSVEEVVVDFNEGSATQIGGKFSCEKWEENVKS